MINSNIIRTGIVYGFRFNRNDEHYVNTEQFKYAIVKKDDEFVFMLLDGVTGFESFYIKPDNTWLNGFTQDWLACMGTTHVYDRLLICGKCLVTALDGIKVKN